MRKREYFNREFKLEAVRLLEEGKKPAADLARELEGNRDRQSRELVGPHQKQGQAKYVKKAE